MKFKNNIYYIILIFFTLIGVWAIPSLVKKATYSPDSYLFVYYGAILKDLGIIDYKDKKMPLTDMQGNRYTTAEFDSLMPLLNFRQLMSDGRLPDSIGGYEVTPPLLRSKSVVFRYNPVELQTPTTGLYFLFESMPKRVGLEMPEDLFRLKNKIEFIDDKTNTVLQEKSKQFQQALEKEGYAFPAQWASGNPNPRKAYDEGYFSLDAKGNLFHIKMVNNRPFVRNTGVGSLIDVAHFSMLEAADKRFYGFILSKAGNVYILEGNDGKYEPLKLDMPSIDIHQDQISIMGNLLHWTVWVTTPEARFYHGLDAQTLKQIATYSVKRSCNNWDRASQWLFPYYLTFEKPNSDYISPQFHFTGACGLIVNALLAIVICVFFSRSRNKKIFNALFVLLTGVAGFVSLLILPNFRK
ncbi:DUF4857 domain-containing protein [Bacteroides sp. 224]|uniref:DUF4857 domain-containing protein n=1 Tax=Bacteroides sp. 224 TaxID=2302936 RepID=UPI0013D602C3|nr:DUF4857 domain-containing protein [Bacteroides sp. 224]NDV67043.1 DUF4857 domain-containing protein [Bacteroides sp. 224]